MAEDKFEQAVIDKLKSEGWEYLTDYSGVTVDRLYDHWRDILDANNRKRLEDTPLSDNEFEQVKFELMKNKTPYDEQLMLAGAGNTPDDQEQKELFDEGILAPKAADKIIDLNPQIKRLQQLAGDDFSQMPRSEKEQVEFAVTAAQVNSQVQQLSKRNKKWRLT